MGVIGSKMYSDIARIADALERIADLAAAGERSAERYDAAARDRFWPGDDPLYREPRRSRRGDDGMETRGQR